LKKAANEVGPLGSKISQGNQAIVKSSGATERFRQRCQKKSEREPVNAVFLLDGIISVPAARGINGVCLQAATSLYIPTKGQAIPHNSVKALLVTGVHVEVARPIGCGQPETPGISSILETFKRHKRQTATERDKCTLLI
jgi:hypothetical protein